MYEYSRDYEGRKIMDYITLGKTGITTCKNAFGCLPLQRISTEDAVYLLQKAEDNGISFFDTARAYSDSEEKVGLAFKGRRDKIFIATKSAAKDPLSFRKDLETSLRLLKTDYIDIYQFHNPSFCPKKGDGSGLYEEMLKAKEEGKIRHIGITNHRLDVAHEAIESSLYETLQFPFCYISGEKELELVSLCKEKNIGFIAMKSLSGGLITSSSLAYAFSLEYPVLPIWGIQKEKELDEFLSYNITRPKMTDEMRKEIEKDKEDLGGEFCRGCGYCMPCPVGIEINTCARMIALIRRAPTSAQLSAEMQEKMFKINSCLECRECVKKCPYSLSIPELLKKNLLDYEKILSKKIDVENKEARKV